MAAVPSRAQFNFTFPAYAHDPVGQAQTVGVRVATESGGARRFTLTTSAEQRDDGPKVRAVVEAPHAPAVHSFSPLFDALFAQAVDDARLDSVSSIADAAYNAGQPVRCECFQGRGLTIELLLPPVEAAGYYPAGQITLNGHAVTGLISSSELKPENKIVVSFHPGRAGDDRILKVAEVLPNSHDDPRVFAPQAPSIDVVMSDQHAILSMQAVTSAPQALRYTIWRDGDLKVQNLSADRWLDPERLAAERRHCYRVVASYADSGNASHPSAANCINGTATRTLGWPPVGSHPAALRFTVQNAGRYALSLTYDNHAFDINTGVTNAVKRIELMNGQGRMVATGVVQMPHIQPEGVSHPYRQSTELRFFLAAGEYVLQPSDYFNMSYLQSNAGYTHDGGQSGPLNDAVVEELQITRLP